MFLFCFFIPLSSSRYCSPVSGPKTWHMFDTPVRGLELSEIWGLFTQILWDPFPTVELRLLSYRCRRLHISRLVLNIEHYISRGQIFPFQAQKFWSFVGSRTRVLSFRSPMLFHCASRPRHSFILSRTKFSLLSFSGIKLETCLVEKGKSQQNRA